MAQYSQIYFCYTNTCRGEMGYPGVGFEDSLDIERLHHNYRFIYLLLAIQGVPNDPYGDHGVIDTRIENRAQQQLRMFLYTIINVACACRVSYKELVKQHRAACALLLLNPNGKRRQYIYSAIGGTSRHATTTLNFSTRYF